MNKAGIIKQAETSHMICTPWADSSDMWFVHVIVLSLTCAGIKGIQIPHENSLIFQQQSIPVLFLTKIHLQSTCQFFCSLIMFNWLIAKLLVSRSWLVEEDAVEVFHYYGVHLPSSFLFLVMNILQYFNNKVFRYY